MAYPYNSSDRSLCNRKIYFLLVFLTDCLFYPFYLFSVTINFSFNFVLFTLLIFTFVLASMWTHLFFSFSLSLPRIFCFPFFVRNAHKSFASTYISKMKLKTFLWSIKMFCMACTIEKKYMRCVDFISNKNKEN